MTHHKPKRDSHLDRPTPWLSGLVALLLLAVGYGCEHAKVPSEALDSAEPAKTTTSKERKEPARQATDSSADSADSGLLLTYIANAGILVETEGRKVLIDALSSEKAPRYVEMSAELRSDLLAARPPFDDVDLVLATHRHADHFDAEAVATFLDNSPSSTFVSTPGALADLATELEQKTGRADLALRARAVLPATGVAEHLDDLGLTVLECHHGRTGNPPIENLCFIAEVGAFTVLHVGDTEMTAEDWSSSGYADLPLWGDRETQRIDLALLTSWQMPDGFSTPSVEETIRPRWIAAIHLVPRWPTRDRYPEDRWHRDWATKMAEEHPEIVVFRDELETHTFSR